jgi:glycosyltransferase involved in cell wall biosynthesis
MHIMFITDNFIPEKNAPATRTFEHCRCWVKLGAKVTIITCHPNFPSGKIYEGYKNRLYSVEFVSGIKVIRVLTFMSANSGFLLRTLDFLSFMFTSMIAGLFVKKVDYVIATSPQFFTLISGYFLSLFKRAKYIPEIRDLWPDSLIGVGALKDGRLFRILKWIELYIYKHSEKIVVVTRSFKQTLISQGVNGQKIEIIYNGVDDPVMAEGLIPQDIKSILNDADFNVGYIGTIGMAHACETLIEAADIMSLKSASPRCQIIIIGEGEGVQRLKTKAKDFPYAHVKILPAVPKHLVSSILNELDMTITHLKRNELFKTVIPSKIFESVGAQTPILNGVMGESAELILKYGVGDVFVSEDANDLSEKILFYAKNRDTLLAMKDQMSTMTEEFRRKILAEKMLQFIGEK